MHFGELVFAQLMDHLPPMVFERCVARYDGNHKVKSFTCMDQFLCMAFAQLTYRESLRDIEACLRSQAERLYHMGIRGQVSRNTLANANATRDWRIYADFAQRLIHIARKLYVDEPFGVELENTAYALDSTTIDLSLSLFSWAPFSSTTAAVKMHTLLDLRGNIPSFIHVTDGKVHDVNILDQLIPEAGAFYIVDRGYLDYRRLYRLHQAGAFLSREPKRIRMRNVGTRILSTDPPDSFSIKCSCSRVSMPRSPILKPCAGFATKIQRACGDCCSSPTIQPCLHSPSATCTRPDGRSNFSFDGSNSICV